MMKNLISLQWSRCSVFPESGFMFIASGGSTNEAIAKDAYASKVERFEFPKSSYYITVVTVETLTSHPHFSNNSIIKVERRRVMPRQRINSFILSFTAAAYSRKYIPKSTA